MFVGHRPSEHTVSAIIHIVVIAMIDTIHNKFLPQKPFSYQGQSTGVPHKNGAAR